jgi:hypothetical protein
MGSRGHFLLAVASWLVAATAATSVGVVAGGAAGTSIVGAPVSPLSNEQVNRALAGSSPTPSRQPTTTPSATVSGITRVLGTAGGTVIARCLTGQATLMSWSPAQGYEAKNILAGPGMTVGLTFEDGDTAIGVRVGCRAGVPTAHITTEPGHESD